MCGPPRKLQGSVAHRAMLLTEYANGSCLPPLPLRCTLWEDSSILRALLVSGLFLNFSLQAMHAVITGAAMLDGENLDGRP